MSHRCYLCSFSATSKGTKRTLHQFPLESNLRKAWICFAGLSDEDDLKNVRICSGHFTTRDYVEPSAKLFGRRLILKPGTIPTILRPININPCGICDPPIEVPPVIKVENNIENVESPTSNNIGNTEPFGEHDEKNIDIDEASTSIPAWSTTPIIEQDVDILPSTSKRRRVAEPRYINEIVPADVATPRSAHRVINMVKRINMQNVKKIRSLQDKNRGLRKRIAMLEQALQHLRTRDLIT